MNNKDNLQDEPKAPPKDISQPPKDAMKPPEDIAKPEGDAASPTEDGQLAEEVKIETNCHICGGELPEGPAIVSSKCGVNFHEDCAKRVARCPACGENLLEHLLCEEAKEKMILKDRIFTILIFALPFIVIELLIGIWSLMNHPSKWSVPPWLG